MGSCRIWLILVISSRRKAFYSIRASRDSDVGLDHTGGLEFGAFVFLHCKAHLHFLAQRWDIPWGDERKQSWLHSFL